MTRLKLPTSKDILQTFTSWATELRKKKFIEESSFAWKTYAAELDGNGLTVTASSVNFKRARYLPLSTSLWFSLNLEFTTTAGAIAAYYVSLPANAYEPNGSLQGGTCVLNNGANLELGKWSVATGENRLKLERAGGANFATGANILIVEGLLEVY